jgi:hypothetical protein
LAVVYETNECGFEPLCPRRDKPNCAEQAKIRGMTSLQNAEAWATIGGLVVLVVGSAIGLSKWNRSRTDAVVLNYMEEHARKHSGNRLQSLASITQSLGMSEIRVTESLIRLRTAGKVRTHGENWLLT